MRRRRSRRSNRLVPVYAGVLGLCLAGVGAAVWQVQGKKAPDRYGCFEGVGQDQTLVLVDASEPHFDAEQARSLTRYLRQLYDRLGFNERLSFFTSEGDQMASVARARFHVCGQASSPEQLEAVNAEGGSEGYLAKQRERLYERRLAPELEALFSATPDLSRRQLRKSPIMELVADLARSPAMKPGSRLVIVSDMIQNSDSAQFCRVKNDMPPFSLFSQRSAYQRLKPRSLEGVQVEVLMLQREDYGKEWLRYCYSEEELRAFWRDYLVANGVRDPHFTRIRYAKGEAL
jgi:hypothetical protein